MCLRCGHWKEPDGELDRAQRSTNCACPCHPWVKETNSDGLPRQAKTR
jgi:hypothetical protein